MHRYVKIAIYLLIGGPVGAVLLTRFVLVTGGIEGSPTGIGAVTSSLCWPAFGGSVVAVLLLLVVIPIDYLVTHKTPAGYRSQGVNQARVIVVEGPAELVYNACRIAFGSVKGLTITGEDPARGELFAKVARSLLSFGEKMEVTVQRLDGDQLSVTVGSKPAMPTLGDWGKGFRNVEAFVQGLRSITGIEVVSVRPPSETS